MSALDAGNRGQESPLSVARKWLPWRVALIFAMTAGWTGLVAWGEVVGGGQEGIVNIAIAVVGRAAPAAPLIVIYAIMMVSALDFAGGLVVVTAKFLTDRFLEPWRERRRERVRAEGRAEERRRWNEWNNRRLAAEAKGEPFDELPPGYTSPPVVPPY